MEGPLLFKKKQNIFIAVLTAIVAIVIIFTVSGCGNGTSSHNADNQKIDVVVSVNQWSSVAQAIGGNAVDITTILNNNDSDPHEFEPDTQAIAMISKAKIVFVNGAGYDEWALKAARSGHAIIVDAAQAGGISRGQDPHIWFSSKVRNNVAKSYLEALKKADPQDSSQFQQNYDAWEEREEKLDKNIEIAKGELKGKTYAATEPVAFYLAEDLGLKDVTPKDYLHAVATRSEVAAADLHEFTNILDKKQVGALFNNIQEKNPTSSLLLNRAQSAGVPIIEVTETRPQKYQTLIEWVQGLVDQIKRIYDVDNK